MDFLAFMHDFASFPFMTKYHKLALYPACRSPSQYFQWTVAFTTHGPDNCVLRFCLLSLYDLATAGARQGSTMMQLPVITSENPSLFA